MEEQSDLPSLKDLPDDKFIELSISLIKEVGGFIPEPWSEITDSLNWTKAQSEQVKENYKQTIINATCCSDEERISYINSLFDPVKSEMLTRLIVSKKEILARAMMKQYNASLMPTLDSMHWRVKWILGNSASVVMRYPVVQLNLGVLSAKKEQNDNIFLEMDKNELDRLITILVEKANAEDF